MKKILIVLVLMTLAASGIFLKTLLFPADVEVNDALPTNPNADLNETITGPPEIESDADSQASPTPILLEDTKETPVQEKQTVFPIEATSGHPAVGNVRVFESPEEKIIRFEDYEGTNGPDLRIYLASDLDATEFIDLGPSRGNVGNINYAVPMDIDIEDYPYVLTWCRAFGVLFDYAQIN